MEKQEASGFSQTEDNFDFSSDLIDPQTRTPTQLSNKTNGGDSRNSLAAQDDKAVTFIEVGKEELENQQKQHIY